MQACRRALPWRPRQNAVRQEGFREGVHEVVIAADEAEWSGLWQ